MSVREQWVIDGYLQDICRDICVCLKKEFPEASSKILRAGMGYFHCSIFDEKTQRLILVFQLFRDKITLNPAPNGFPTEYSISVLEDPDGAELLCAIVLDTYLALI